MENRYETPAPLDGIRVVAFTHFAAGPVTAQYLGALGADVVKIEGPNQDTERVSVRMSKPGYDGCSPYFFAVNRNQRGIGVNLKSQEGCEAVHKLVEQADIIVENFRPGVLDKLGLGYEGVKKFNPGIIYCTISGYDLMGPSRDDPGQDLLIEALSGLASMGGWEDTLPVPAGTYAIDSYTTMNAVVGVLAALRHRDRTGEGQWVRVDMMCSALHMMAAEASYVMNGDPAIHRSKNNIAHVHQGAPYGIYKTCDGAVALSSQPSPEVVGILAEELGVLDEMRPYLSEKALREQRDEVAAVLARPLSKLTKEAAVQRLTGKRYWVVPVNSLPEALEHPAVKAADVIRTSQSKLAGTHRVVVEPLKMDKTPIRFSRPAPDVGEHTVEVLLELGYSEEKIQKMMDEGAVFTL